MPLREMLVHVGLLQDFALDDLQLAALGALHPHYASLREDDQLVAQDDDLALVVADDRLATERALH